MSLYNPQPEENTPTVESYADYQQNNQWGNRAGASGPITAFGETFPNDAKGARDALDFMQHKFRPGTNFVPNGKWQESGGIAGGGGNMSTNTSQQIRAITAGVNTRIFADLEQRSLRGHIHPTRRRHPNFPVKRQLSGPSFGAFGTWNWGGNQQMEVEMLNTLTRSAGIVIINPDGSKLYMGDMMGILGFDGGGSTKASPKNFKLNHSYGNVLIDNGLGVKQLYGIGEDVKGNRSLDDAIRMDVFTPGNIAQGAENTNLYQIIENDFGDSDAFNNAADVEAYITDASDNMSWSETTPSNQVGSEIYTTNAMGALHSSAEGVRAIDTIDGGSSDGIGTNGAAKMLVGEYTNPSDSSDKRKVAINHESNAYVTENGTNVVQETVDENGFGYRTWYEYNEHGMKVLKHQSFVDHWLT